MVQVRDAIRGETNEHTKELFAGTADKPAKEKYMMRHIQLHGIQYKLIQLQGQQQKKQ